MGVVGGAVVAVVGAAVVVAVCQVCAAVVALVGLVQPVVVQGPAVGRPAPLAVQLLGVVVLVPDVPAVLHMGAVARGAVVAADVPGVLEVVALGVPLDVADARALGVVALVVVGLLVVVAVGAGPAPVGAADVAAVAGLRPPGPVL